MSASFRSCCASFKRPLRRRARPLMALAFAWLPNRSALLQAVSAASQSPFSCASSAARMSASISPGLACGVFSAGGAAALLLAASADGGRRFGGGLVRPPAFCALSTGFRTGAGTFGGPAASLLEPLVRSSEETTQPPESSLPQVVVLPPPCPPRRALLPFSNCLWPSGLPLTGWSSLKGSSVVTVGCPSTLSRPGLASSDGSSGSRDGDSSSVCRTGIRAAGVSLA
mmetsp:Transcript_27210/g.81091  ORF Transcript_27210/g.81091 Transcript_27210/m.81091 type:complete len:227 (-) Transcript_27210:512-1192(-)